MWDFLKSIFADVVQTIMFLISLITLAILAKYSGFHFFNKEKGIDIGFNRKRRYEDKQEDRRVISYVTLEHCQNTSSAYMDSMKQLSEKLDAIAEKQKENELNHYKILFLTNASLHIRMQAGLNYVKHGGKDATRDEVRKLVAEYPRDYQIVTALDSSLKVF